MEIFIWTAICSVIIVSIMALSLRGYYKSKIKTIIDDMYYYPYRIYGPRICLPFEAKIQSVVGNESVTVFEALGNFATADEFNQIYSGERPFGVLAEILSFEKITYGDTIFTICDLYNRKYKLVVRADDYKYNIN